MTGYINGAFGETRLTLTCLKQTEKDFLLISFRHNNLGAALKRLIVLLIGILMVIPVAIVAMQDNPSPIRLQITGINVSQYPTVVLNANVFDKVGQPILGLGQSDFEVLGQLRNNMKIVKVENLTDDSLSFAVVLAIDTSTSMTGEPIERTKEAAISFINSIGPTDPVAIVTFDNKARLVLDYTTDKTVLTDTINNLRYGGQTALYDGATLAISTAAKAPTTRRAVIILSDGQEYRASLTGRGSPLETALDIGVPVYTIGEGFGFDRSFMQGLADGTVGEFYESPTPEQLNEIYSGLARTFRSQYIITMTSDLPGDGKTYPLDLQVKDKNGATAKDTVDMRARIFKPIVSLPDLPTEAIAEATDVTAQVQADDAITSATFQLDKGAAVPATEPYTFTIDPANLTSGPHTLTFSATDSTGDTTSVTGTFNVAPKPPTVTITGVGDTVDEVTTATITGASTEGTVQGLIVKVNDAVVGSVLNQSSTTVTLDPAKLPPGENTMTAIVRDTAGGRAEFSITFTVPAIPPTVTLDGITAGETITENRTVTVNVDSPQTAVSKVVYKIDGVVVVTQTEEPLTFDLDVKAIGIGNHILTVEVTNEGGTTGKADVAFVIAAPPTATPTATSTSTNTPLPPTATDTNVPPTNTNVPPTATNTSLPATATNTSEPATATNTSAAPTVDSSATAAVQANLATNDAATVIAAAPTNTTVSPTDTSAPPTSTSTATDTNVPPTGTSTATDTKVPPTSTSTATDTKVPPTSTSTATKIVTATSEATAEVTEAATSEVTQEATAEVTEAATSEVTQEVTAELTEAATSTTTATTTNEATAVSTNAATGVPTFTPIPLTAESQGVVGQSQSPLLIAATCLLGLLLLAIVYWFAGRRRSSR
ncbi:MAG: VWA domain-containing protein [Anaerolineaceae bacterium]|nr:VWA domain-containing protein [Anaerolineaceae bacterium]